MKKVTNKQLIDYCNLQGKRCEGARCKYLTACDIYFDKYDNIPGNEEQNHPENYTDDVIYQDEN